MNSTIRPNTAGAGWTQIAQRQDIPREVIEVRAAARAKMIDHDVATTIDAWIKQMGWQRHDAPVFLEPLE